MANTYRFIGKTTPRMDGVDIVTGKSKFLDDLKVHDLLYGRPLRSPHAHALIKSIDKTKALTLPGVKAVLTWKDVPDWRGGTPRSTPILGRKVRYVGDVVALVAATSPAVAEKALGLINVEYEALPAVMDPEEALKPGAPQLYDESPGNIAKPGVGMFGPKALQEIIMGDVAKGFQEADVITEGTFAYENMPNPMPPEPPGAIALWTDPNLLTLWVSNQSPYMDSVILHHVMGRKVKVRTIGGACGGSYGTKTMSWQIFCYAGLLSRATGKPVKVVLTKEEHLAAYTLRPACRMTGRVGMKKDGTVTAVAGQWIIDTGYYSLTTQAQVAVGAGEAQIMVKCPNWDLRPIVVYTNRNASGIVRGFGGQELKCVLIPLLSLAMQNLDIDPFEFLKKNFVKPGDGYYWRDGIWYTYRGADYTRAMEEGARRFGWKDKWKGWLTPTAVNGTKRIGVGVGVHGNADVGEDSSEAYVRLHPDGTVWLSSCFSEHGTGQRSNIVKMAAEVLQIPMERFTLTPSDSDTSPYELGPAGSRGTFTIGNAVIRAAEDARRKLLEIIAPMLKTQPEDLDTIDGVVFVKDNQEKKLPWKVMGVDRTVTGYGRFDADYTLSNIMMSFVEVEVDTETGKVDLLRVVNATDVGQVIDPPGMQGQLYGCLGSAGIDSALFEEMVLDRSTGHMLNANMIDYKWRTFPELPRIDNVIVETPVESTRFHAIGVGEIATSPGPSAILMAVSNALGIQMHGYPMTPEKVLAALQSQRHRQVNT
ncbi:MAG: 4-hydroxybenzoyl-CoA reductase subunit alpha [Syntrophorhabdaceae bacterium PtaU1.Bin034]|nr:MAG: 4-hydroxybenzoyl-CoA reductase subunit alpha [Syntrophorhabdaceae bacterium PtaU1.Bin034]